MVEVVEGAEQTAVTIQVSAQAGIGIDWREVAAGRDGCGRHPPGSAVVAGAVVVDASVWVSRLVTNDVFHRASRRWLTQHAQASGQWVAPAIMPAEVVGAISRRTGKPELATRALKHLLHLPGLRLVALDRRLGKAAAQLAAAAGLRGEDAVYAALAQYLSIPLVTWDEEIEQRAGDVVTVIQPPRAAAP